jgi:hypothetical protein
MSRKSSPDAGKGILMQNSGNHASQRNLSVYTVPAHDIERGFFIKSEKLPTNQAHMIMGRIKALSSRRQRVFGHAPRQC